MDGWVCGGDNKGRGGRRRRKTEQHVCEPGSSDAPVEPAASAFSSASRDAWQGNREGATRREYQISSEPRKGGQAELGNLSCCLAEMLMPLIAERAWTHTHTQHPPAPWQPLGSCLTLVIKSVASVTSGLLLRFSP